MTFDYQMKDYFRKFARLTFFSNMKIISCVRFELDFRGQIFTRRRSIAGYVTDEGGNMDRKDFQR